MIFREKCFSCYILLTDQISLSDYLYLRNMYLVIVCYPVRDVIKFEIYLSFLIKLFSYMTKNLEQKLKYIKEQKEILS